MPTKIFLDLEEDKKKRILEIGITEFATYGYTNSSTNRIVKNARISKGSLFKYFNSKEELYFYILDIITKELTDSLGSDAEKLPKDLFDRIIEYSKLEFTWYMKHPQKYKMILSAFSQKDNGLWHKIKERYCLQEEGLYYQSMGDIDASQLKGDTVKTIELLKWFLKGFNETFINSIKAEEKEPIENLRDEYVKSLTEYIELLKMGLVK